MVVVVVVVVVVIGVVPTANRTIEMVNVTRPIAIIRLQAIDVPFHSPI